MTSLRARMVATQLLLVALALAAIGIASVTALRGHLLGRLDAQLARVARDAATSLNQDPRPMPGSFLPVQAPSDVVVLLHDSSGDLRASTDSAAAARIPAVTAGGEPVTAGEWRIVSVRLDGSGRTLTAATSLDATRDAVRTLVVVDLVIGGAVMLVLAGAAVGIVRLSLRPLVDIERTAGAIAAGDLSRRVPERPAGSEVGRLGRALNGMLAQIESAFRSRAESEERMRRFVADAGHELRTPLTAIRGSAELYRQHPAREVAERDRLVERIEARAAHMGLLVEDLLLLARLDQERPLERKPVDLVAVAAAAVQEARDLAPERQIDLAVRTDAAYLVTGDEARLRQVLGNLLTNALHHTPIGSSVQVRLLGGSLRGTAAAVLEVADDGPGLEPEQAARVFERFYRADPARSRADGGSGLGLAIVAALVAAHGGEAAVDTAPGAGATFRIILPLATVR